ncbi:MAG: NAD(P)(+) transhydrogenase (Re/Si-specific) subunit beta, partial [Rhodothermales bacterium]
MIQTFIELAYVAAAILFILGMKRLQSPTTARAGNQMAAAGMLVAVVATLFLHDILSPVEMISGLVIGGGIGVLLARKVEMTGMPELVAAFNGFGGLASALVAGAEVARYLMTLEAGGAGDMSPAIALAPLDATTIITIVFSVLIGTITFSGSFVAFGKLGGYVSGNPIAFPGMRLLSVLVVLGALGSAGYMLSGAGDSFAAMNLEPIVQG